ncbi:MAG: c-type cytochrome [Nitrospirota bacterium]|nr:MAG: c-type cytochrome [Nitrospirota bacterium]
MSKKGARNLFIIGSLFFAVIFIGLTVDTMRQLDSRAPEITDEVNEGKMLWHKYDCIGCHTILGNGSYFAPDLTKTTTNKPTSYLVKFLANPREVNKRAAMPDLGITDEEAGKIVAFLDWVSKVDTNGWPPEPVLAEMIKARTGGSSIYAKYGCSACHTIRGVGGTSGPDLSKVGSRQSDPEWHKKHINDPQSVVAGSAMPPYPQISGEELNSLADYLISLK